jgi:hypothetical protein
MTFEIQENSLMFLIVAKAKEDLIFGAIVKRKKGKRQNVH